MCEGVPVSFDQLAIAWRFQITRELSEIGRQGMSSRHVIVICFLSIVRFCGGHSDLELKDSRRIGSSAHGV